MRPAWKKCFSRLLAKNKTLLETGAKPFIKGRPECLTKGRILNWKVDERRLYLDTTEQFTTCDFTEELFTALIHSTRVLVNWWKGVKRTACLFSSLFRDNWLPLKVNPIKGWHVILLHFLVITILWAKKCCIYSAFLLEWNNMRKGTQCLDNLPHCSLKMTSTIKQHFSVISLLRLIFAAKFAAACSTSVTFAHSETSCAVSSRLINVILVSRRELPLICIILPLLAAKSQRHRSKDKKCALSGFTERKLSQLSLSFLGFINCTEVKRI